MSEPRLSGRARGIQESPIRKLAPLAVEAELRGTRIYHLNIGQPDIPTPSEFWKTVKSNMGEVLAYGPSNGLPELREAICGYYESSCISLSPEQVMITTGGSEAVVFAMMATCDPGDEIICFEPFYTNYNGFATLADVKLVPITSKLENGFHLPPVKEIQGMINDRTRAILICNPNNPTGTILTDDELSKLAKLVTENDLFLLADEVYRDFAFDGRQHSSILELPEIRERAVVMDSISKRFSSCGARLGNIITRNSFLMSAFLKFGQARLCPPTLPQYGAAEMYRSLTKEYFQSVVGMYQKRRDILMEELHGHGGISFQKPEGAFYATMRLPVEDTDLFAAWMLSDYSVNGWTTMIAPAAGFYATPGMGKDEIRIAYVLNEDKMKIALNILKSGLEEYISLKR
ncbi:MAG: aminotransferase class I/II-fold pyridoxal phosphate-dependent enzyme [Candidatus Aegiribacteria sp.]|nr:aminotransferase class I/II-fold pyridoxal phosphate-dependent enzyme [Candidatus Aegiribacteria sp.]MBD3294636.1 aminotransferase class I/II-fold pyridoxal phosphate-dependent enzyme [Candidatus Fermentibacteria bacterium]